MFGISEAVVMMQKSLVPMAKSGTEGKVFVF